MSIIRLMDNNIAEDARRWLTKATKLVKRQYGAMFFFLFCPQGKMWPQVWSWPPTLSPGGDAIPWVWNPQFAPAFF
jgi:hypothetical protein